MTHQDGPQPYGSGEQQGGPDTGPVQQPGYGSTAYGQPPYGQPPQAQPQYGQQPYVSAPYGPAPYGQAAYGQVPAPQHGGYPGQYGPPVGYAYAPPQKTNGLAIASMVLGILWLYWIGAILALVFGYIARNQIRERGENGTGMAIAGIVLGWVWIGLGVIFVIVGVAASTY